MGFMSRSTATAESPGRYAILGSTNYTDTQVSMQFYGTPGATYYQSLIVRWTDSSNFVRFTVSNGTAAVYELVQVVAGTPTVLASGNWTRPDLYYRLRLSAFASGRAVGEVLDSTGTTTVKVAEGSSSSLATGGTLDDGKPGMHDQALSATASNRYYTDFSVSVPPPEPVVLYSGQTLEVRHDDTIREDSTGTYYGRPQSYRGSRFLAPVGTSRVLVKARRNDVETAADNNVTDATQIQVGITPRGLAVPRS